ncbi:MAG: hypothetical protein P0Y59_13080 [Candidatus Sphingomonas phytovorans]|nr:hypothetical protein [Sphingomonas sp.]WEJ97899.1 MAG: hypothetical protein P0Y59_13080 [Sphingomonas sp.]
MLVRIALAAALLGAAAPAVAASDAPRTDGARQCALAQHLAPHGKGVTTPIVKCDTKAPEIARNDQPAKAPAARN